MRITEVTATGTARVVEPGFDSEALDRQTTLVEKCLGDAALYSAVKYFDEEVIDTKRPLYGIHKAIEALSKECGGRAALGNLVGKDKTFVDGIMQTAQLTRPHEDPNAKRILTDEECKERAKLLIMAYAGVQVAPPSAAPTLAAPPAWAVGPKQIFCAACQAVTTHDLIVDHNNEIVVTCRCGRLLKFPAKTEERFSEDLAVHQRANQR